MKGDKDSYGNTINSRSRVETGSPDNDYLTLHDLGNYAQADIALAKRLNTDPASIREYRENNGLTWHECRDGVTMQLIPTEINSRFKHAGGVNLINQENQDGYERDYSDLRTKRS